MVLLEVTDNIECLLFWNKCSTCSLLKFQALYRSTPKYRLILIIKNTIEKARELQKTYVI